MANAEEIIETIRSLPPEERQKVREFVYNEGEAELQRRVQEGLDQLDRGETVDGQEAFARLRKRARELSSES